MRILQWNADSLATKQHELRLRLNDDSIDIYLIQETKLLPKDTTPYGSPLERLTVQVQLSRRKWAT